MCLTETETSDWSVVFAAKVSITTSFFCPCVSGISSIGCAVFMMLRYRSARTG